MTETRFPVEAGHILQFARAIGDDNPAFQGAMTGALDGVLAPPTFTAASAHYDPEYPLRPRPGQPWFGSGRDDGSAPSGRGGGGGGLHAEQHFEYHQPVRAGMVLTATRRPGQTWEKEGRRGGKLHFTETITEFRDEHGDLVVTARTIGVRTERAVQQEG